VITGPTPAAAARAVRAALQQSVSCVASSVVTGDQLRPVNELQVTSRVALSTGGHVTLTIEHRFGLVLEPSSPRRALWQAQTLGYLYTLDDAHGREVLAYHWHPSGRSPMTAPHLHLGAGAGTLRRELEKAHVLTGHVTPVALLTLMIENFGVRPRRADWPAVLHQADLTLSRE
jgi:hypothetical protein